MAKQFVEVRILGVADGNRWGASGQLVGMDSSLRGRVRAGDPEAFEELFDAHVEVVYNHGFRLTGSWSTAEEVVSLTFLEAWRIRRRVDAQGGSLRPWLLGIATNVTRNLRRAAQRHQAVLAAMPAQEPSLPDFADDVVDRMENAQRLEVIQAVLQTLSRPEREVVALCVWAELSYPDRQPFRRAEEIFLGPSRSLRSVRGCRRSGGCRSAGHRRAAMSRRI